VHLPGKLKICGGFNPASVLLFDIRKASEYASPIMRDSLEKVFSVFEVGAQSGVGDLMLARQI
jgi:hypothetical protein